MTVRLNMLIGNAELIARDINDLAHFCGLRNLDVGLGRKMLVIFPARAVRGGRRWRRHSTSTPFESRFVRLLQQFSELRSISIELEGRHNA